MNALVIALLLLPMLGALSAFIFGLRAKTIAFWI